MEANKTCVNVTDINRKRSSLKTPLHTDDLKKIYDFKSKNIQFELESVKEVSEKDEVINFL